jgi:hypothetical protein
MFDQAATPFLRNGCHRPTKTASSNVEMTKLRFVMSRALRPKQSHRLPVNVVVYKLGRLLRSEASLLITKKRGSLRVRFARSNPRLCWQTNIPIEMEIARQQSLATSQSLLAMTLHGYMLFLPSMTLPRVIGDFSQ